MWWKSLLLSAALAVFSTTALSHHRLDPVCTDRKVAVKTLANSYKESGVAAGVVLDEENGEILAEIFSTPTGKTLTITLTGEDGKSCQYARGHNLEIGDDLGKIRNYPTLGDYVHIVAHGNLYNGQPFVVIANHDLKWEMLSFGPDRTRTLMLKGESWHSKTIPIDPEI